MGSAPWCPCQVQGWLCLPPALVSPSWGALCAGSCPAGSAIPHPVSPSNNNIPPSPPIASVGFSGVKPSPWRPLDHVPSCPPPLRGPGGEDQCRGMPRNLLPVPLPLLSPPWLPGSVPPLSSWQLGQTGTRGWLGQHDLPVAGSRQLSLCLHSACMNWRAAGSVQCMAAWPTPWLPVPGEPPKWLSPAPICCLWVLGVRGFFSSSILVLWFFLPVPARLLGGTDPFLGGGQPPGTHGACAPTPPPPPAPGHTAPLCLWTILAQLGVISVTSVFFKLQYNGHIPCVAFGFLEINIYRSAWLAPSAPACAGGPRHRPPPPPSTMGACGGETLLAAAQGAREP